jgi:hypothetical protein
MYFLILLLLCANATRTHGTPLTTKNASAASNDTVEWRLHQFLRDNGMKYASIVENCTVVCKQQQQIAFIAAKSGSIYAKTSTMDNYMDQYYLHYLDVQIFIFNMCNDDFGQFLHALTKAPVESTVILIRANWTSIEMRIRTNLIQFVHDTMFYLVVSSTSAISWYQVITMKSGYSMKKIAFFPGSSKIIKEYDLNGLTIYSIGESRPPYFTFTDCNKDGTICKNHGYLKDYTDMIARKYNFTYESHWDGDWGTQPKSGPYNISGEWGGVMGSVVMRKYDMSLADWAWHVERYNLLSFVAFLEVKAVLAWTPKNPKTDFGLFTRPLTRDSWVAVWMVTFILALSVVATHNRMPDTNGLKIMVTTVWFFYLLLSTYYGGALTMFFTSENTIPFNSIYDVMKAHQDWKLVFGDEEEASIVLYAEIDPDYAKYWALVQANPDEYKYKSVKEGLDMISESQTVMKIDASILRGYINANPFHMQRINVFATVTFKPSCLIFPHNSPLKPIFTKAAISIQEKGLQGRNGYI